MARGGILIESGHFIEQLLVDGFIAFIFLTQLGVFLFESVHGLFLISDHFLELFHFFH